MNFNLYIIRQPDANSYEQYPLDYSNRIFHKLCLKANWQSDHLIIHREEKLIYCLYVARTDFGEKRFALGLVFNNIVHKQLTLLYDTTAYTVSKATKTRLFIECDDTENRKKIFYYHQTTNSITKNINAIRHIEQFLRNRLNNSKYIYKPEPFYKVFVGAEKRHNIYGACTPPFCHEINHVQTLLLTDYTDSQRDNFAPPKPTQIQRLFKHLSKYIVGLITVAISCALIALFIETIHNNTKPLNINQTKFYPVLEFDTTSITSDIDTTTTPIIKIETISTEENDNLLHEEINKPKINNKNCLPNTTSLTPVNNEPSEDSLRRQMKERMFN